MSKECIHFFGPLCICTLRRQAMYYKRNTRAFIKTTPYIILRMRNVSNKICRENQNTRCMCNKFFSPKNLTAY